MPPSNPLKKPGSLCKSVLQRTSRWKIEDVTATILSDIDLDTDEEMIATDDEPMAADNTN